MRSKLNEHDRSSMSATVGHIAPNMFRRPRVSDITEVRLFDSGLTKGAEGADLGCKTVS
jgi:hypothetical protein